EDLMSARAVLATHHDGEPLSQERGAPLRLILPHLYSWKGPKGVRGWNYTLTPERGFWEERGYHLRGDAWREERYSSQEYALAPTTSLAEVAHPVTRAARKSLARDYMSYPA